MTKLTTALVVAVAGLLVLVSTAPTLAALAHATAPLIIAIGSVVVVLRLVWYFTSRY